MPSDGQVAGGPLTEVRPRAHSAQLVTGLEQAASSTSVRALVEAARGGDESAFGDLYRRLAGGVFDYLAVLTGDRTAAEDLLQQTFLDAWQGLMSLQDPEKVKPWVYALARHKGQDYLRSRTATVPLEATAGLEAGDRGPDEIAMSRDATRLVWSAASSLEPQHQEALNLSLRHGLSNREIGDVLGLRPGRVADLLLRSREALGGAVRLLFIAQSSDSCAALRTLAPQGAESLTREQRRAVDRHVRQCAGCRDLGLRLTRPEELFGAIILATLPATAKHGPPPPPAPLGPAKLAAAHSGSPRSLHQRLGLTNRQRRISLGIGLALLIGIGAAVVPLPAPPPLAPKPTPSVAPSDPASIWAKSVQDLTTLTSYRITFTAGGPRIDVTAFDITVGPAGSWYGSVTDATQPSYPLTMADENGALYVQGGHDFVAVAPGFFSLTTAQAQSLGSGWLNVDTVQGLSEGTILENALAPYALPGSLADEISLPLVTPSASPTTAAGQAAVQLSADGTLVLVTRGAHPYPLSIDEPPDHFTLGGFNQAVMPPDLSGAVTWSQLTGGSPPP